MGSVEQVDGSSAPGATAERREKRDWGVRGSDVLAGACVASVAAVAGGYLGAFGSVASAFMVSMISGITLPILRTPLRSGEDKLRGLAAKKAEGKGDTSTGASATTDASTPSGVSDADEAEGAFDADPGEEGDVAGRRKHRFRVAVATTLIAFLLAFAAIFVVQAISGTALSNGTGQLQERVTGSHPEGSATPSISPSASTETAPTETTPTEDATDDATEEPTTQPSAEESESSDESTSTQSEPAQQETESSEEVDPVLGSDQADASATEAPAADDSAAEAPAAAESAVS
ncbi:hypothetical protein SAMN02745244_01357 [Tessaracoccus bendigoensis DSM 12906]|uniref:Uncharacterized protein n=2 Tax=Tessaracoccus TaxID=72763 RepID=A0A1M6F609_9ACTN|nr:hypothetical protein SAMN02745244_01357 [Tessaracoccus bendigoensis DSM 12906]